MAIVNQYKFLGTNVATTDETTLLTPAVASSGAVETVIIKSLRVTNNTGNTPTITIKNGTTNIVNAQTLVASASTEILTLPLFHQIICSRHFWQFEISHGEFLQFLGIFDILCQA